MGLVSFLLQILYDLVARSHVLFYLRPLVLPICMLRNRKGNHQVVDRSNCRYTVFKAKDGRLYPRFCTYQLDNVPDINVRDSDVILCGYPKTGCNWMYAILKILRTRQLELPGAGEKAMTMLEAVPSIVQDSVPSPRILNSHLLYEDLPPGIKSKGTKIIYTTRNPKDLAVSFYHHISKRENYKGEFGDYFQLFMDGDIQYGSYFDYTLSWDEHIKRPERNSIMVVPYEELKARPKEWVMTLAQFLDIDITDQFAQNVAELTTFEKMRATVVGTPADFLFRKGEVNDWKNWLTDAQSLAVDKVWKDKMMGCTWQPTYSS